MMQKEAQRYIFAYSIHPPLIKKSAEKTRLLFDVGGSERRGNEGGNLKVASSSRFTSSFARLIYAVMHDGLYSLEDEARHVNGRIPGLCHSLFFALNVGAEKQSILSVGTLAATQNFEVITESADA